MKKIGEININVLIRKESILYFNVDNDNYY